MNTNNQLAAVLPLRHNHSTWFLSILTKTTTRLSLGMVLATGVAGLTSCQTRAGTGAAAGAGTGALIGGPPGAAVGAGVGALGGAAMDERHGARR